VTQIVPLDYSRAEEGITLLKQVASKTARVEIVSRSNAVLITDRGVHIARYLDLLRQLDVKTGGEAGLRTYVYPLKHASATELATTLGQVFGAAVAAPPARARVQALGAPGDDRAARRPAAASAAGGVDRRGHPRQGEPIRDQLAGAHPARRRGGLDAWDRRRRRPADLRGHAAAARSGPRRPAGQPGELECARDLAGARHAHQRARALHAPDPRAEQRGSAHPGRQ